MAVLKLVEPDGSSIEVTLLTAGTRAGLPSASFEVDGGTWDHVESDGLLHADPARRRGGARPFDPGRPVQIDVVLDPVAAIDGVGDLRERLEHAGPGDSLLSTEAWWALSATQEVDLPGDLGGGTGSLHEGISYEHPAWLQDAAGSVGLEEAWNRAMELGELLDGTSDTPLLDLVTAVFADQGWNVDRPEQSATILHAPVASDHGDFDLYVRTDEQEQHVTAFAVLPLDVPGDRVPAVLELAARLNGGMAVGSYEADADTGLLAFKAGIDVNGDRLSVALVRQLVGNVLVAGERAMPVFAEVVAGEAPLDAAANLL